MKIRTGFVSNSSSSSFVVGFKEVPKTIGQLFDTLFPDKQMIIYNTWGEPTEISTFTATVEIFDRLLKNEPLEEEDIALLFKNEYKEGYKFTEENPSFDPYFKITDREESEKWYENYDKETERVAALQAKQLLRENPEMKFFHFEFEDKGPLAELERGNQFDNLVRVKISNH